MYFVDSIQVQIISKIKTNLAIVLDPSTKFHKTQKEKIVTNRILSDKRSDKIMSFKSE